MIERENKYPARLVPGMFQAIIILFFHFLIPAKAEQGIGTSSLFTVDTRWGFSDGAGVSGFFTVDTRSLQQFMPS